jgi:hypothetical protein
MIRLRMQPNHPREPGEQNKTDQIPAGTQSPGTGIVQKVAHDCSVHLVSNATRSTIRHEDDCQHYPKINGNAATTVEGQRNT